MPQAPDARYFEHIVSLHSPTGERSVTITAWIDTRHLYCVFPGSLLRELGCEPNGSRPDFNNYQSQPEYDACDVLMSLGDGQSWHDLALYGPDDCECIVGRLALDSRVLEPDPEHRSFKKGVAMMVTPFYIGEVNRE